MADASEVKITNVSLILGPGGIKLDQRGRILFVDPEILQALVTGSGPDKRVAAADNYLQCSCNNYQCGKALSELSASVLEV